MAGRFIRPSFPSAPSSGTLTFRRRRGKRLKRNWRDLQEKIILQERKRFKEIIRKRIYDLMIERLMQEKRTYDGQPLPAHATSTILWRKAMKVGFTKLKVTQALWNSLSVKVGKQNIIISNSARTKKGFNYPEQLNLEGWSNLDIPREWEVDGSKRRQVMSQYYEKLVERFDRELYQ